MKLAYEPLLALQRDLYRIPPGRERFDAYVRAMTGPERKDIKLPLMAMNPMAKDHVPELLDKYLALGTERIAAEAVAEAAVEVREAGADFHVCLVLADDARGKWTNRCTTEFDHCFRSDATSCRGWLVGLLWSSEAPSERLIRGEIRAVVHRAAYQTIHGRAKSLGEMLRQEGAVLRRAGPVRGEDQVPEPEASRSAAILRAHLQATDMPTLIGAFFGDDAARSLGYPPLGLPDRGGFAAAWRLDAAQPAT